MEISVIVTNYNYGRYLGRCIRSLLSQDLQREQYEVVVVDDFSTDDSIDVLKPFFDEIRLIRLSKNSGLSVASNAGIEVAKGRYVVRVDADDYVHASFLRTLLLGFELYGNVAEAVSCDYSTVSELGSFLSFEDALKSPIACAIAFKVDALEHLGRYNPDLRRNEEIDLRERFNLMGYRQVNINLPLYRYVQHDDSLSRKVIL